ncbi:SigE family RNA polymerase sigma factor [Streptomyces sp. L7]
MNAEDEREFREFVAARSRSLLQTAYLLTGDWEQGRDLVQTALASTARRWSRLRDRQQPETYVRRAIYHAQIDRFRLLSWGKETVTDTLPEPPAQAADWADTVVQRQDIMAALRRLPKRQRAVIVLRYFEDLPDPEIAEILGISQGTVRSQTHKALTSLRSAFAEAGPTAAPSPPLPPEGAPSHERVDRTPPAPCPARPCPRERGRRGRSLPGHPGRRRVAGRPAAAAAGPRRGRSHRRRRARHRRDRRRGRRDLGRAPGAARRRRRRERRAGGQDLPPAGHVRHGARLRRRQRRLHLAAARGRPCVLRPGRPGTRDDRRPSRLREGPQQRRRVGGRADPELRGPDPPRRPHRHPRHGPGPAQRTGRRHRRQAPGHGLRGRPLSPKAASASSVGSPANPPTAWPSVWEPTSEDACGPVLDCSGETNWLTRAGRWDVG